MATNKTTSPKRYLTEAEIANLDLSTLTPEHPLWGTYLRPPLEGHPATEQFLDQEGIEHEDFANWLANNLIATPVLAEPTELLALARLFACHRHKGVAALNAAYRARAKMH